MCKGCIIDWQDERFLMTSQMDTVEVILQPYANQTFILPKDWLRKALPSSILASALEDDPNATSILIPNPVVTPDVLQLIVDLSEDREPPQHNPHLLLPGHYLNIPELLCYADYYYDRIPNRNKGAASDNKAFIEQLLQENRIWPFDYLIRKGYVPTDKDLILAAMSGATDIVRVLLADPKIDPAANYNAAIRWAAEKGYGIVVRSLLADPRVDPAAEDNYAIRWVAGKGHVEVVRLLLADHRVDPAVKDNSIVKWAAAGGHVEEVRLLLADHRVDPAAEDNYPIRWAATMGHIEVVRLLLTDPRVRNSLSPADLAEYQQLVQQRAN